MPDSIRTSTRTAAAAAVRALVPNTNPTRGEVALRSALCLAVLLVGNAFAGVTGQTAYVALNYPVLIYAGLSLPWQIAAGLFIVAAVGPNPHGSVLLTALRDHSSAVIRPLAMAALLATAIALARSQRRSEDTLRASESRLFSFLESMPVAVSVLDSQGRFYYTNSLSRRLTGRDTDSIVAGGEMAEAFQAYIAGSDSLYPVERMPVIRALHGETSMVDDMVLRRPEGDINLQVWGAPIRDDQGNVLYAVAAFSNITAQKRFERALIESETRFRAIFEEGPLGMAIIGPNNRFLQVNQALCELTGYRGDELAALTFLDITHPDDRLLDGVAMMENGANGVIDVEKRYLRKGGEAIWVRVCVRTICDADGQPAYKLKMVQDISEQRRAQALIEHMAYADPLTDLPNRRLLYDRLQQAIAHARRHGEGVVLLSIDLDGFKSVNDRFGHAAGDALLIETAERLRRCVRDTDTVARMGGDEFLVLLANADSQAALVISKRIDSSLSQPVGHNGSSFTCRPSIGMAAFGADGTDTDSLVNAADARMYEEKAARALAHR